MNIKKMKIASEIGLFLLRTVFTYILGEEKVRAFKKFKLSFTLSRDYFIFFLCIAVSVILLCIIFSYNIHNSYLASLQTQKELEAARIERALAEVFDETKDHMVYLGKQIAERNPTDISYIASLFKNISGAEYKSETINTWTLFDWITPGHLMLVNSKAGRLKKPLDMSFRTYTWKCPKYPWELQMSPPAIGIMSNRWVIPMGVGVTDTKGNYIGVISGGFNIAKLNAKLEQIVAISKVSYVVIDEDFNTVLYSANNGRDFNTRSFQEPWKESLDERKSLLNKRKGAFEVPISHRDIEYSYYRHMSDYPFYIIVGFERKIVNNNFHSLVFPRVLECIGIGSFFLILLYLFRRTIINPIVKLSDIALQLSKGNTNIKIIRPNSLEMYNLTKGLLQVIRYIKREQTIHNQLEYALNLAKTSDEAREDFLRCINSKLNEQLNSVLHYSKILLKHSEGSLKVNIPYDKHIQFLRHIHEAAINLRTLTTKILDLSPINVKEAIENCIVIQSKQAFIKKITLEKSVQDNLPPLYADELRFKQIVVGLLSLGINYTPKEGKVKISASLTKEKNETWLLINIEDNSFGINEKDMAALFRKFGNCRANPFSEELDLELPTIEKLVKLHQGNLQVQSKLHKGTTVTVKLPYLSDKKEENHKEILPLLDSPTNILLFPSQKNEKYDMQKGEG